MYRHRADDSKEDKMKKTKTQHQRIVDLVMLALLTALTAVLGALGSAIPIGATTLNLALVPVIIGAALYGYLGGAWLGGVSGVIILVSGQAAPFMLLHVAGTIITVMVKGILSGLCAGLAYKALKKINKYLAIFACAAVCPIVNTGIFLFGCLTFFKDSIFAGADASGMSVFGFLIVFYVGFNFLFELLTNLVLAPAVHRIITIWYKEKH